MSEETKPIHLKVIQNKLYERLIPSGWGSILEPFILSDQLLDMLRILYTESMTSLKFTPKMSQLFRAFEECNYEELKVVLIGQDPYYQLNVADGIAFSCSNTMRPELSLQYIFDELQRTVYPGESIIMDPNLKRWANQGILSINTAFTTTINKVGVHFNLWRPFINYILDTLNQKNRGLVYVFLGKKAAEYSDKTSKESNHKIIVSHPASAAYRKTSWNCEDVFNKVSKLVEDNHKYTIIW